MKQNTIKKLLSDERKVAIAVSLYEQACETEIFSYFFVMIFVDVSTISHLK